MPNIQLVLEYDGSEFHGWQRQPRHRTVQGCLEEVLAKIGGKKIAVSGSGRTDAGVHAEALVAHFKTNARMDPSEWMRALNALLPEDVVVLKARKVPRAFHARFSARGKIYRYRLLNRRHPCAINRRTIWTIFSPLKLRPMQSAAKYFIGQHDFAAFQASDPSRSRSREKNRPSAVCSVRQLKISQKGDEIILEIEANRFLQSMVRVMVGTLVEVGRGKIPPRRIAELLKLKDRSLSGPTAPARGLSLVKVKY